MPNRNKDYMCGSYMPGRNISEKDLQKIDFKLITHVFLVFLCLN